MRTSHASKMSIGPKSSVSCCFLDPNQQHVFIVCVLLSVFYCLTTFPNLPDAFFAILAIPGEFGHFIFLNRTFRLCFTIYAVGLKQNFAKHFPIKYVLLQKGALYRQKLPFYMIVVIRLYLTARCLRVCRAMK